MIIKLVHIDRQGLELFLGSLECTIMCALWEQSTPITMAHFYRYLTVNNLTEAAYSTIITTLNRLADKKLITRQDRDGKTPMWSKAFACEDAFIETCMIATLNVLRDNYNEQFSDYIGVL